MLSGRNFGDYRKNGLRQNLMALPPAKKKPPAAGAYPASPEKKILGLLVQRQAGKSSWPIQELRAWARGFESETLQD